MQIRKMYSWNSLLACMLLVMLPHQSQAISTSQVTLIPFTESDGHTIYLADNRQPAIYSQDYGDCMGGSLVDLSRFNVAYYKDNGTILFQMQGTTGMENQTLMIYLEIYAYGKNYWSMIFNPCSITAANMCPMNRNATIQANGLLPVSQDQAALIPDIALSIPDFEAQAVLRIFSNNTKSEIACYATAITNGHTFSHPGAVGPILGVFTLLAILASFFVATSAGNSSVVRKHYAHTISALVVFEVFHHIYFTGALSMNWPSVLPAFWSNFAWTAGMIRVESLQRTISDFARGDSGSLSRVGALAAGSPDDSIGGGYTLAEIYGRSVDRLPTTHALSPRGLSDVSSGFTWYGSQVKSDFPNPGNYSGFAGTLATGTGITVPNAFMTGFLWFLVVLAAVVISMAVLKWTIEGLAFLYLIKRDKFPFFRSHWLGYIGMAFFRTALVSFFTITFLSLFQLSYGGSNGVRAVAAITFAFITFGLIGIAIYACFVRIRFGRLSNASEIEPLESLPRGDSSPSLGSEDNDTTRADHGTAEEYINPRNPFWKFTIPAKGHSVHDDEEFTKTFGWLSARHKGSRWWFFMFWLVYQFIRACFLAGAISHALTQVFGLLVVEILAFAAVIYIRPYEGQRLNALVVYCLGVSKVITTGLAACFDVSFNLPRIETTAIGVVIIVIQGILTLLLLAAISSGVFTAYLSLSRNHRETGSKRLNNIRDKYFLHVDRAAIEAPKRKLTKEEKLRLKQAVIEEKSVSTSPESTPLSQPEPAVSAPPYFRLASVRRINKIQDDAEDSLSEGDDDVQHLDFLFDKATRPQRSATYGSVTSVPSMRSRTSLPYGARGVARPRSWSTREQQKFSEDDPLDGAVTPQSPYTPLTGSPDQPMKENLAQFDDTPPVPPMPDLSSNPYFAEDSKINERPLVQTRSLSSSESTPSSSRPRSVTFDTTPLENIPEIPVWARLASRPRSSTHEPLMQQDLASPAILAAHQVLQRQLSTRSQKSMDDKSAH